MLTRRQIDEMSVIQLCRQSQNPEDPVISQAQCLEVLKFELFHSIKPPALREEEIPVAIVLLAAGLLVGPNVDRLAELTGFQRNFVEQIAGRMFACGLWEGEHVHPEFLVDDYKWHPMGLTLNVFVAQGLFTARQVGGKWAYEATEKFNAEMEGQSRE